MWTTKWTKVKLAADPAAMEFTAFSGHCSVSKRINPSCQSWASLGCGHCLFLWDWVYCWVCTFLLRSVLYRRPVINETSWATTIHSSAMQLTLIHRTDSMRTYLERVLPSCRTIDLTIPLN